MKINQLPADRGKIQKRKRVGRGEGSGRGKTAGRGTKGQRSRSGGTPNPAFEGGQTPLYRRLPKRGFTNIFRQEFAIVNVNALNIFEDGEVIDPGTLRQRRLVRKKIPVKILGEGSLAKKLTVKAHRFSGSARQKIEACGGTCEIIT